MTMTETTRNLRTLCWASLVCTAGLCMVAGTLNAAPQGTRASDELVDQNPVRLNKHAEQAGIDPSATPMRGERIPAEAISQGYIEGMQPALDRAEARGDAITGLERFERGFEGEWAIPSRRSTFFPHSGEHYAANKKGDPLMPLTFNRAVDVAGTYIAAQGNRGTWAEAVRVVGYRGEKKIGTTDWFDTIDETPRWMAINLQGVDRLIFEAKVGPLAAGWYSIDDFTYLIPPTARGTAAERVVVTFDDLSFRHRLSGTTYGGINWGHGMTPKPADWNPLEAAAEWIGPDLDEIVPSPQAPEMDEEPTDGDVRPEPISTRGTATAPTVGLSFEGVERGDAGSFSAPPDTHGAVGPDHLVMVVNRNFAVYDKSDGTELINILLGDFLPGSNGDPRVIYDQHSDRWIVIVTDFDDQIFLAVSLTDDPTGSWFKTDFLITQGSDSGGFPDYPTLGVDEDGIYLAAYIVSNDAMTIYAIDKAPLLDAVPSLGTITAFRDLPFEWAIQPCHTYGTPGPQYFVSISGTSSIRLRSLLKPITTPTLVTVDTTNVGFLPQPPDIPSLGSAVDIDSVDRRLMNAVYRDGFIYTANAVDISGRAGIRWYKMTTTGSIDDQGSVTDSELSFVMPTICVNHLGDIALGFSGGAPSQFMSCYYTGRLSGDPAGAMAPPVLLKLGTGPQDLIDSFGRNRWGDYSLTSLDPDDEMTIWTAQEWCKANDTWSNWFAELIFPMPPDNNDCTDALAVTEGVFIYNNELASTDGPQDFGGCFLAERDLWYRYTASCTGNAAISTCGSSFDTVLVIYGSTCPDGPAQFLLCNDDFCGTQSNLILPVVAGEEYLIRVGGKSGATGDGVLTISCTGDFPCDGDIASSDGSGGQVAGSDGTVDLNDVLFTTSNWGACPGGTPGCDGDIASSDGSGGQVAGGDGIVDLNDVLFITSNWGACP